MQTEIAELRSQNELLKGEQRRLESEIKKVEAGSREQKRLIWQQQWQRQRQWEQQEQERQRQWKQQDLQRQQQWDRQDRQRLQQWEQQEQQWLQQWEHQWEQQRELEQEERQQQQVGTAAATGAAGGATGAATARGGAAAAAVVVTSQLISSSGFPFFVEDCAALPGQFPSSTRQSPSPSSPKASISTLNPFTPDSRSPGSSSGRALGHLGKPPAPLSDLDESFLEAMRLQDEFDEEDRAIRSQHDKLAESESAQRLFVCGICLEEMPYDSIACPDPCGHTFCRECLRGHVTSRLDEHRFPILCPTCIASKGKGKGGAGSTCYNRTVNFVIISCYVSLEVSQSLALQLGLTDKQYSIWSEMEMVSFSVLLTCRKYVHGVRPPQSSTNIVIGANGRCSWLETNTKKLRPSLVRFLTATMCGASNVNSRLMLKVQSTRAMARRN